MIRLKEYTGEIEFIRKPITVGTILSRLFILVCYVITLANFLTKGKVTTDTNANFIDVMLGRSSENEETSERRALSCSEKNPIADNPHFSRIFDNDLPDLFHVWDGCDPLPNPGMMCEWYPYKVEVPDWIKLEEGQKPKICLSYNSNHKYLNHIIKTFGRWTDCPSLIALYNKNKRNDESIYIEIGTNFGQCIFDFLFSTNATIVAFENDETNLYQMTSTLMTLPDDVKNRVALFYDIDYTFSSASAFNKYNVDLDNVNELSTLSLVQKFLNQASEGEGNQMMEVTLTNLFENSILNPESPAFDIALMKIDVPGKTPWLDIFVCLLSINSFQKKNFQINRNGMRCCRKCKQCISAY